MASQLDVIIITAYLDAYLEFFPEYLSGSPILLAKAIGKDQAARIQLIVEEKIFSNLNAYLVGLLKVAKRPV